MAKVWMIATAAAVVVALLQLTVRVDAFKFSKCGGNNDLDVRSVTLEPEVLRLPGTLKASFSGGINRPFRNMDMNLSIKRKTFLGSVPIPCLFNFGSCFYPDLCTMLDRMIEENWAGVARTVALEIRKLIASVDIGEDRSCPYKVVSLDVKDATLDLPSLPSILGILASGKYGAKIELINRDTQELITCLEFEIDLERGD